LSNVGGSGRTTHVIAAEINMIKYQAERVNLAAAVEIGRRLTEAKALLKYGEWGKWLEESVDFSQSRANKLMRIFKEYGAEQLTSSNSDLNPNLNYSQAVLLLGIPKEERAQFIIDMDIEGMTNQELRKAVNERKQETYITYKNKVYDLLNIFWLFGFRQRRSWLIFLAINLVTQGALNLWLNNGGSLIPSYLIISLIIGEFFVFLAELIGFSYFIKEHKKGRILIYVIVANLLSLIAGGYIISVLPV